VPSLFSTRRRRSRQPRRCSTHSFTASSVARADCSGTGGLETRRWRKADSNCWSHLTYDGDAFQNTCSVFGLPGAAQRLKTDRGEPYAQSPTVLAIACRYGEAQDIAIAHRAHRHGSRSSRTESPTNDPSAGSALSAVGTPKRRAKPGKGQGPEVKEGVDSHPRRAGQSFRRCRFPRSSEPRVPALNYRPAPMEWQAQVEHDRAARDGTRRARARSTDRISERTDVANSEERMGPPSPATLDRELARAAVTPVW
jgi:hypothetical protein